MRLHKDAKLQLQLIHLLVRDLLIEDDPETAKRLADCLRTVGYDVDLAFDRDEGCALSRAANYVVMIVDRMLSRIAIVRVVPDFATALTAVGSAEAERWRTWLCLALEVAASVAANPMAMANMENPFLSKFLIVRCLSNLALIQ
jgi:hypothetical protein